jgi:hypothetical protein
MKERVVVPVTFLRKVNRGAAVTIAVVLAVTAYLIVTALAENAQKPAVQKACEEFLADYTAYSMLPQEYRSGEKTMTQEEFDAYIQEMRQALTPHYVESPKALLENGLEKLENGLLYQFTGGGAINTLEREVLRYESFVFEGDFVTVKVTSEIRYTGPSPKGGDGPMQSRMENTDTVMLRKTGAGYKVVSASITDMSGFVGMDIGPIRVETKTFR